MLFLHSTPDDHRLWLYQTAHFSAWYRTIAVDLAGYGRSPPPQAGVRIADHAEACWEAVDRIASGSSIIIQGNSVGSFVALHMAAQQPRRTLALLLSGCGYLPTREMMVRWKTRYQEEGIALRHGQILDHFSPAARETALVRYYAKMITDLTNEGTLNSIIAMNEALSHPDPEEFFDTIKPPTLIISGTADRNHPAAFELQKRIKGSEIVSIEGAGHSSNVEAPWEFDDACIRFLSKHKLFPAG
jgi:3-oxoadipate enol-lactonase